MPAPVRRFDRADVEALGRWLRRKGHRTIMAPTGDLAAEVSRIFRDGLLCGDRDQGARDVFANALLALRFLRFEFGVFRVEGVGDVLEKDQAEDDVLVLCRVHVVAQSVCGRPKLALEPELTGAVFYPSKFL
jgi:hypothetical protein